MSKPEDLIDSTPTKDGLQTQAIAIWSGFTQNVRPDCSKLLALQAQKLESPSDAGLISIDSVVYEPGFCYLRMNLFDGQTLRQLSDNGAISIDILIEIANVMGRVSRNSEFQHGNLKPEHILVGPSGTKIIAPGYFGILDCAEGNNLSVAVTTTAYYPMVEPNDLLAFGIMLWEIATRRHPLLNSYASDTSERAIGHNLAQWVETYQAAGQYFLSPILRLRRPSELIPEVSPLMETFLLQALKLKINEQDQLDRAPGFRDFAEIENALLVLKEHGIEYF